MEEWKPIEGWPYEVSDLGRVRRSMPGSNNTFAGKILACPANRKGYKNVSLWDGQRHKNMQVHQLVMKAFVGDCPNGCETNHIDGIKKNNKVENLEYISHAENMRHAKPKLNRGEKVWTCKNTPEKIREIRRYYDSGLSTRKIGNIFGLNKTTILRIVNRTFWSHVA